MRIIIANCSNPCDHALHISRPRHSMYSCVEDLERRICPGGRAGDRAIRQADDIADLVAEYDRVNGLLNALADVTGREVSPDSSPSQDEGPDEPDEPDYDEEYEADRAADRYEAWLFRD